jgi:hypothetical protein
MPDITTLRDHLFTTLEALQDKKNPMAIDRARAISDVAQTIINSAKVEIDHMKLIKGSRGSGLIPLADPSPYLNAPVTLPTAHGTKQVTRNAAGGETTIHRMA